MRAGWSKPVEIFGERLARLTGVRDPAVRWRLVHDKPWFDNHISTVEVRGREATLRVERTVPEDLGEPLLERVLEYRLS